MTCIDILVNENKWRDETSIMSVREYQTSVYENVHKIYESYNLTSMDTDNIPLGSGVAIIYNNSLLLVKENRSNMWGLPKGKVEFRCGENKRQTWQRELYEETGIILPKSMKIIDYRKSGKYFIEIVSIDINPIFRTVSNEISNVKFVTMDNIDKYMLNSVTENLIVYMVKNGLIPCDISTEVIEETNNVNKGRYLSIERKKLKSDRCNLISKSLKSMSEDVFNNILTLYTAYIKIRDMQRKGINNLEDFELVTYNSIINSISSFYNITIDDNQLPLIRVIYKYIHSYLSDKDKTLLEDTLSNDKTMCTDFSTKEMHIIDKWKYLNYKEYYSMVKDVNPLKSFVYSDKWFNLFQKFEDDLIVQYLNIENSWRKYANLYGLDKNNNSTLICDKERIRLYTLLQEDII